jgi:hypothetical protein
VRGVEVRHGGGHPASGSTGLPLPWRREPSWQRTT